MPWNRYYNHIMYNKELFNLPYYMHILVNKTFVKLFCQHYFIQNVQLINSCQSILAVLLINHIMKRLAGFEQYF